MDRELDTTSPGASLPNLFDATFFVNPFPLLAQMRSRGAIVQVPFPYHREGKAWIVTRLQEAVQILKDQRRFTVEAPLLTSSDVNEQGQEQSRDLLDRSMSAVDGLDHRRLRGLVSKAFTPKYIQSLRPDIQRIADELLDQVQDRGCMDLVHDYAYPLSINIISDMVGIPLRNRRQVRQWSEAIASGRHSGEEQRRERQEFADFIAQAIVEKRHRPQDDLLSRLIQMEEEGDRLSEDELLSMVALLIFAGHETTSNLISIGALMLLDHPEHLEKLKADLRLVPAAVEELLRISGSALIPAPRFATEDIELAGQQIRRGDTILVLLPSVNRDEAQFSQPDELDITRDVKHHIAFGQGTHACLGAPLARLEADIAFTTLLRRMPNLRLNAPRETITWRGKIGARGLTELPVAF